MGDHHGPIAISDVIVINDPPVVGSPATATIELRFFEPLPDDRFTLWIADQLIDPAENQLDGETNAVQPLELPQFPSGDGVSGGEFVARFTVDSRPEIGVTASTRVYVDINGNFTYDPEGDGDTTNKDLIFRFGVESDAYFAGNFAPANAVQASGFDKLGVFGVDPLTGQYRFLLDFDHNGVADFFRRCGGPDHECTAGGRRLRSLHPATKSGCSWAIGGILDTNGDNIINVNVDTTIITPMRGIPAVGDVNGDGLDDLIVFDAGQDIYFIDLNRDGTVDDTIAFGLPDFLEPSDRRFEPRWCRRHWLLGRGERPEDRRRQSRMALPGLGSNTSESGRVGIGTVRPVQPGSVRQRSVCPLWRSVLIAGLRQLRSAGRWWRGCGRWSPPHVPQCGFPVGT